ncbi:MAG: 4-hydroxy-tetrahydrodipicolinate synthase [candidate division TA06 bacterium 32_111]|nr:MAG: 4-hydroxy-tetrahydrodipicolinate synthase [candidate division TA06 bacterium 32_111]
MKFKPRGIIPPMITTFDEEEKVDCKTLKKMTDYLIDAGVHGVFPLGSTGEGYGIDFDEKKKVIETVLEAANNRVPVYAGTGAITTKESIRLTQMATKLGVDALSVITPYFISPNEEELYTHYKEIASSTDLPIILYNNPGRTGVDLSIELIIRLSSIDNIVGIKDSSGDMSKAAEIIRRTGKGFAVLAGRDTLIYGFLAYGAHGSVAATANIVPELVVSIYELYQKGEHQASLEAQFKLAPLRMAFALGSFPVIMKEGLKLRGIDVGNALKPIKPINEEAREKLKKILDNLN